MHVVLCQLRQGWGELYVTVKPTRHNLHILFCTNNCFSVSYDCYFDPDNEDAVFLDYKPVIKNSLWSMWLNYTMIPGKDDAVSSSVDHCPWNHPGDKLSLHVHLQQVRRFLLTCYRCTWLPEDQNVQPQFWWDTRKWRLYVFIHRTDTLDYRLIYTGDDGHMRIFCGGKAVTGKTLEDALHAYKPYPWWER